MHQISWQKGRLMKLWFKMGNLSSTIVVNSFTQQEDLIMRSGSLSLVKTLLFVEGVLKSRSFQINDSIKSSFSWAYKLHFWEI
ncbi:hypothetical protein CMV_025094 [Castanea mollissima]|uniref:Uncharacterized protein n=1 Tax=Castanea mollissima TaxID=60419 RepID=A0A8J4VBT5_9ROSI|nr:hypothetical protein CMV_025094 [Castanea mollissima]